MQSNQNELSVNSIESISQGIGEYPSTNTMMSDNRDDCQNVVIPVPTNPNNPEKGFTTMTPQEIANWIDRRSRVVFPASFIFFNILYWGFVWI